MDTCRDSVFYKRLDSCENLAAITRWLLTPRKEEKEEDIVHTFMKMEENVRETARLISMMR